MGRLCDTGLGQSSSMILKDDGRVLVLHNRASANILVFLSFGLGLTFALVVAVWPLLAPAAAFCDKVGHMAGALLVSILAGGSYRKRFSFDRRDRLIKIRQCLFFVCRNSQYRFADVESVFVCLSRRLVPGIQWPGRVDNHQLWLRLQGGACIYVDMAGDEQLIENWRQLIQATLDFERE